MNETAEEDRLLCNLKDAGCNTGIIEKYLQLHKAGRQQEQLRLLAQHRASLLDQVHVSQHMIDCLDYLMYTVKNES